MTKLFGCTTAKAAFTSLNEIHAILDKGGNPFVIKENTLNNLFDEYASTLNPAYRRTATGQYSTWVRKYIGGINIAKITTTDLDEVFVRIRKANLTSTQKAVKGALMPVFKKAELRGLVEKNLLRQIEITDSKSKVRLNATLVGMLATVRSVFEAIKNCHDRGNARLLFLLSVMTAKRIGELWQLEYSDIDFEKKIITPNPETTKTKKKDALIYTYPIPEEVFELLDKNGKGRIFPYTRTHYTPLYTKMLDDAKVTATHRLTSHINRHFFISIMAQHFDKDFVGEVGLSHADSNNMNSLYLTHTEEKILEMYTKYWNILRGID